MGELKDGDSVFDEQGKPCKVIKAHDVLINRKCYILKFSDGSEIVADEDHLWKTWTHAARKSHGRAKNPSIHPQIVTTKEIRETLTHCERGDLNHSIRCTKPLSFPKIPLPIAPYLLGLWLGDGHSSAGAITTMDPEIIQAFRDDGYHCKAWQSANTGKATTYGIHGFHRPLRKLGLINNKHIPEIYQRSSEGQRRALLQGLLDTDGSCDSRNGARIEITQVRKNLALEIHELALGLGYKATLNEGRAILEGRDCGPKYRVCFGAYSDQKLFKLPRKQMLLVPPGNQSTRNCTRYITAVEPVETRPVRCITVDSPSKMYLCGRTLIPTHNTFLSSNWLAQEAIDYPGDYATIGKTDNQVQETNLFGPSGILRALEARGMKTRPDRRSGIIRCNNGSTVYGFSERSSDRVRGYTLSGALFDELAFYNDPKSVFEEIGFAIRAGRSKRVITTTPSKKSMAFMRALAASPVTKTTKGSSLANIANLSDGFLADLQAKKGSYIYRVEIDGELVDSEGLLFNAEHIGRPQRYISPQSMDRTVVGVDPAMSTSEDAGLSGIVVCGTKETNAEDGKRETRGFVLGNYSVKGTPHQVVTRALEAYYSFNCEAIVIEKNQGGHFLEAAFRNADANARLKMVTASQGKALRAEPIALLYEMGRIFHVRDFPDLEMEMLEFDPDAVRTKHNSPDQLDALIWAFTYLFERKLQKVKMITEPFW